MKFKTVTIKHYFRNQNYKSKTTRTKTSKMQWNINVQQEVYNYSPANLEPWRIIKQKQATSN